MPHEIVPFAIPSPAPMLRPEPHNLIVQAGTNARFAHDEFFAGIDNPHTERSYRRSIVRFLNWCQNRHLALQAIGPADVSEYLKQLAGPNGSPSSKPTKKLCLAALRKFFDRMVERHAVVLNPAVAVRGPRLSVQEGKTPAFSAEQARALLKSIDVRHVVGLRDRAVLATLIYTAARVGAVSKLRRRDLYQDGRQHCLRLDEKGGKVREIPLRADLEAMLYEYLQAANLLGAAAETPLFQSTLRRTRYLTGRVMTTDDILRMLKRRLRDADLPLDRLTCHSFRATTITDLLSQGVALEDVQYLAGHADPRTTRLYDRRQRSVTRNIVERISI
jgi:integrase/recombinase XerD